jgi:hypothetical protein
MAAPATRRAHITEQEFVPKETPMSNQHDLRDTLVTIQREIDEAVGLINETPTHVHHELLTVAQWLYAVREPIVEAQQLLSGLPAIRQPTQAIQVVKVQPVIHSRVVQPLRNRPTTTCRICKASVYQHDLESHLVRVHHQAAPLVLPPKPKKQPKAAQTSKSQPAPATVPSKASPIRQQKTAAYPAPAAGSPAISTKRYEICPVCKNHVRQDRLEKHLTSVHPQAAIIPVAPVSLANQIDHSGSSSTKKSKARKGSSVSAKSQAYLPTTDNDNELSLEALDQSYRDRRDGGKELSQSRRDHGQFGSFPVHDDYSEDSYS